MIISYKNFLESIKEHLDIKELLNGYNYNQDKLKNIEEPIKSDDGGVYIFRFTNKEEVDDILNDGRSGKFWASNRDYLGDYLLISTKKDYSDLTWTNLGNRQEYFLSWKGDNAIHTKNPKYLGEPTIYNTHFHEVGQSRKLSEIIDIVNSETGESILQ